METTFSQRVKNDSNQVDSKNLRVSRRRIYGNAQKSQKLFGLKDRNFYQSS
jgi:hypothetical protein